METQLIKAKDIDSLAPLIIPGRSARDFIVGDNSIANISLESGLDFQVGTAGRRVCDSVLVVTNRRVLLTHFTPTNISNHYSLLIDSIIRPPFYDTPLAVFGVSKAMTKEHHLNRQRVPNIINDTLGRNTSYTPFFYTTECEQIGLANYREVFIRQLEKNLQVASTWLYVSFNSHQETEELAYDASDLIFKYQADNQIASVSLSNTLFQTEISLS